MYMRSIVTPHLDRSPGRKRIPLPGRRIDMGMVWWLGALWQELCLLALPIPLIAMLMVAHALFGRCWPRSSQQARSAGATRWKNGAAQLERRFPPPRASSVAESQAGLPNGIFTASWPHPAHLGKTNSTTGEAGFFL